MKNNELHMSFPALAVNEGLARMCVAALAAQLNPTVEEIADIRTAVSEAVTNAIIHGYNSHPFLVYVDAYIDGEEFRVIVRDNGFGIRDVKTAMQPFYTTLQNGERSGMGFSVMQAFMDKIEVDSIPDCGTTVTLTKYIKKRVAE